MINVTYMFINYLVFVFLKTLLRASTRLCSYISHTYLGLSIFTINDLFLLQNNIIFMENKDYHMYHTTNNAFDFSFLRKPYLEECVFYESILRLKNKLFYTHENN